MLASSFNRDLAHDYGEAMAKDCKARGVDILLGPGVNIARAPMCGRNFEYMGEDPYLSAQTATGYIRGLQDNGVMAVVKHFTANFQEYDRNYTSSDIDERTLHEIYFPAFKAAVQEAETGSIMSSYNLLNGVWTTEDPTLLKGVLRDKWGFNGMVMSDWGSTHNCVPAAKSGLDLEMAGNEIENEDALRTSRFWQNHHGRHRPESETYPTDPHRFRHLRQKSMGRQPTRHRQSRNGTDRPRSVARRCGAAQKQRQHPPAEKRERFEISRCG
jgi:beta-glucosidase-like glycosyl hydrolase